MKSDTTLIILVTIIVLLLLTMVLGAYWLYRQYQEKVKPMKWLKSQVPEVIEDIKGWVSDLKSLIPQKGDEVIAEKENYRIYRRRYRYGGYGRRPRRFRYINYYYPLYNQYWNGLYYI